MIFEHNWFHFNNTTIHHSIIKTSMSPITSSNTFDKYRLNILIEPESDNSNIYKTEKIISNTLYNDYKAIKIEERKEKYVYDILNKNKYRIDDIENISKIYENDIVYKYMINITYTFEYRSDINDYIIYNYFTNYFQFRLRLSEIHINK